MRSLRALLAMWVACALLVAVVIGIAVPPPEAQAASESAPSAAAETIAQPGARGL